MMLRPAGLAVLLATWLTCEAAEAQLVRPTPRPPRPAATEASAARSLRARIGAEPAARLLRSPHFDERLRGIRRAGALATPDMLSLLAQAVDPGGPARTDGRLLLEVARALAPHASQASARAALMTVLNLPTPAAPTRPTSASTRDSDGDAEGPARFALARSVAALALAQEETSQGDDALATAARGGGAGASAALLALEAYPPERVFLLATGAMTAGIAEVAGRMADLRLLDALRAGARSPEAPVRAASLDALAHLGDARVVETARPAQRDPDPRVRLAAAEALLRMGDPEARTAILALLEEEETVVVAARLTAGLPGNAVVEALVNRLTNVKSSRARQALLGALGRRTEDNAVAALVAAAESTNGTDALFALARSPAKGAPRALESLVANPARSRDVVRAYALRVLLRGDESATLENGARALAKSAAPTDRAVGVFALVALGKERVDRALTDKAPEVRRAAAMGAHSGRAIRDREKLLAAYAEDADEGTRVALAGALATMGDGGLAGVPVPVLEARFDDGGADAPLALEALGPHARGLLWLKLKGQLGAADPLRRAAAARALGRAPEPEALGLLAAAYRRETSALVRHAVILGLAAREGDGLRDTSSWKDTLELAARFDPESALREDARRALVGLPSTGTSGGAREATVLTLEAAPGGMPRAMTGVVLGADGNVVPITFDDDGVALVCGLRPGEARLVLAPRFASYEAPRP